MSESMFVAVSADRTVRKFGYAEGVGHAFMVAPGFQRDPLAWLSGDAAAVTACGRTADGVRLVEKSSGDKMCGRCCRVVTEEMVDAAYADMMREPAEGESVADMIMADPSAVLITLDTALAVQAVSEPVEPKAKVKARKKVVPAMLPLGPERDKAVAELWAPQEPVSAASGKPKSGKVKPAKDAGQKIARQSEWKPVKEVAEAVACEPNAAYVDNGDGKGTCRSCGWVGPVVEVAVEPSVKAERSWCTGGKIGPEGCTACGRDVKVTRAGNMARHKTPAVVQEAQTVLAMASHWKHGKAPKTVVTDLVGELKREPQRAPLADAPATVNSGLKSADDQLGGAQAGMYRGRTSLTRGSDMTGAVPREREEGGNPVPTTNDSKLGSDRLDVSARTDKRVVSTDDGSGVKVESTMVGGVHGFLTADEYERKRETLSKEEFGAFKKWYWRRVKRVREQAERVKERKAVSREQAKRRAREAELSAGKRIAATAPRTKGKR